MFTMKAELCIFASKKGADGFLCIHNSNFIQQCQSTMKSELRRIIVTVTLRPTVRELYLMKSLK